MPAADFLDPFASLWNAMGVQLRHERKLRGVTLDDVAKIIDADRQRVGNYEAGRLKLTKLHVEALDEAALTPPISDDVVREQLQALLDLSERASLRILPASEWHVGYSGSFELITTLAGTLVGYMWAQLGGKVVLDGLEVRELGLRYDRMSAMALSESATRDRLMQKLESLQ
ncbi:Scr1 family TA system antitoxin-like transcriptional regulator [Spirillospora sp. NPDC052269]